MLYDLEEMITSVVGDSDGWLDELWTISELNGNLIIRTTEDNHRQITQLMSLVRAGRRSQMLKLRPGLPTMPFHSSSGSPVGLSHTSTVYDVMRGAVSSGTST